MTIKEIELIVFSIKLNTESLLYMKFYKTGTIMRQGVGGAPAVNSSGIGFDTNKEHFESLITSIPLNLLDRPLSHEDKIINDKVEYVIAFYGVSNNGFTEEEANWTKSTGIHFSLDSKSETGNEVLSFVDGFTMKAVELTNEWYFDIIMKGHFDMQSSLLTKNDICTTPKQKNEKKLDYENYLKQTVLNNNGKWNIQNYFQNKIYINENMKEFVPRIVTNEGHLQILFFPVELREMQYQTPVKKKERKRTAKSSNIDDQIDEIMNNLDSDNLKELLDNLDSEKLDKKLKSFNANKITKTINSYAEIPPGNTKPKWWEFWK